MHLFSLLEVSLVAKWSKALLHVCQPWFGFVPGQSLFCFFDLTSAGASGAILEYIFPHISSFSKSRVIFQLGLHLSQSNESNPSKTENARWIPDYLASRRPLSGASRRLLRCIRTSFGCLKEMMQTRSIGQLSLFSAFLSLRFSGFRGFFSQFKMNFFSWNIKIFELVQLFSGVFITIMYEYTGN